VEDEAIEIATQAISINPEITTTAPDSGGVSRCILSLPVLRSERIERFQEEAEKTSIYSRLDW